MALLPACARGPMRQLRFTFDPLLQRERGPDESHVRKSLGKVAQGVAGRAVNLLGVKAEIIPVSQKHVNQVPRLFDGASTQGQIFRLPEAADGKGAFRRQGLS